MKPQPILSETITETHLNDALTHVELRLRRQWKDDFAAALRGQLNDLVSHVEDRVEGRIKAIVAENLRASVESHEASTKALLAMVQSDRDFWIRYREALKDEIKGVCLETLQEFHVIDENAYPASSAAKAGN